MSALGSLVVKLALEYAEYTKGLDKSDQATLKFAQGAQKHFDKAATAGKEFLSGIATTALTAVGAFLSVSAVIEQMNRSIDSLAGLDDMAQKTGSAVENLSRLQQVASAFGADFSSVDGALVKLAKGMATVDSETSKTHKALRTLGVSAKTAAGELRDPSEVMVDVAKRLQDYEDGAAKAALMNDVFGKSGADLLPYMNDVAESIDKFTGASAQAAAEAARYQDQIGLLRVKYEAFSREIVSAALPAMNDLLGAFTDMVESEKGLDGSAAADWADNLAVGVARVIDVAKLLPSIFSAVAGSFRAVYADIEFGAKAVFNLTPAVMAVKLARGGSPLKDLKDALAERNRILEDANQRYDDLWNKPANVMEQAMLARIASRKGPDAPAAGAPPHPKSVLSYTTGTPEAQVNQFEKLNQSLQARIALTEKEIALGRPLSDSEREIAAFLQGRADGTINVTDKEAELLQTTMERLGVDQAVLRNRAESEKLEAEALAADQKKIAAAYESVSVLQEEIANYGRLPEEITRAKIAKLESLKADLEANEGTASEIELTEGLIRVTRQLADLQGKKAHLDYEKKSAEEASAAWHKSADEMSTWIGDGLQRGFENSGALIKNLVSSIESAFSRLVLNPVVAPISSGMASMFNPAAAEAGGNGDLSGAILGVGGLSGSVAAGAGWLTGATTLSGSLSAAGSLFATGSMAGSLAGAGMVVGALAPVALGIAAAVAIWKKLDTSGTYHTGGASRASADGVTTIRAESLNFEATRVSAETEKMTATLASGIVGILDRTALAFGKTAGYTAATAFADDTSGDGAWGGLVIEKLGAKLIDWQDTKSGAWAPKVFADGAAGQAEYLAALSVSVRTALDEIGLPDWAGSMLDALGDAPSIETLAKTVETITATQRALGTLGERLVGFAGLSDAAAAALMSASGGIDALSANASVYYDKFYSAGEKADATIRGMTASLAAVGLALPKTDVEYRAMVETQLALGEAGAKSVAVLLANAGAFYDLMAAADALSESSSSAAADLVAARNAMLESLGSAASSAMDVVNKSADAEKARAAAALSAQVAILNAQKSAAQESIDSAVAANEKIKSLAGVLQSTLDSMSLSATTAIDRVVAQEAIDRALSVAKLTGVLPDADSISGALRAVAQPNQRLYASYADFASDYYITAGKVADLNSLTGSQLAKSESALSVAKAQLQSLDDALDLAQKAYDDQVAQFDAALTVAQAQLEAANGNSAVTLSLSAAISALGVSITNLAAAKGTSTAVADASTSTGADDPTTAMIKELYRTALGREGESDGIAWWRNVAAGGASASQIAAGFYGSPEYIALHGAHADGGVASGWSLVGEEGPEVINFTQPARVYTASQSRAMLGGSGSAELVAEVRALREDNANMRAELRAIAGHTAKTSRVLERVVRNDAISTREVLA